jgi:hypothetical protein
MNQILTQNSYLCIKNAKWYIVDWEIVLEIDNVHLRSQHTQDFFYNRNYDYYIPFTIVSNSDYLWKSDILVGSIVICHDKSILGYNSTEHCSQVVTFFK